MVQSPPEKPGQADTTAAGGPVTHVSGGSGGRLGRKTDLADMAAADTRAAYVAVSTKPVGTALRGGGLFGALAEYVDALPVIALLALLSMAGAGMAWRLEEVG